MDVNTCFETTKIYHTIALYAHLVPISIALFLSIFASFKTNFSKLSIAFFAFTFTFSLWLAGSLIDWVSPNYYLVYFTWSWLDYINVLFFVFGAYFFALLTERKMTFWEMGIFFILTLPVFIVTFFGHAVTGFDQAVCNAFNNGWETTYKLYAEGVVVLMMILQFILVWKKSEKTKKIQLFIVLSSILLFFAVFGLTEYLASVNASYQINLYGLFVLPVFLIVMVFSITNLGLFRFRFLGTQILAYVLIIMVGSQFLFIKDSTDKSLSIITFITTLFLAYLLLQNAKKEMEQREEIEELSKQKSEFMSFASHEIRNPLTAMKGYAANILDGDYGDVAPELKDPIQKILVRGNDVVALISQYLDKSKIELGQLVYHFADVDLAGLVKMIVSGFQPHVEQAGLKMIFVADDHVDYTVNGDEGKLKEVISNLLDNSIKYTKQGSIDVSVSKKEGRVLLKIADTGVGIKAETIPMLFKKFGRADEAKANILGTGLGLYLSHEFVTAHKGKIWVESEGEGKGAQFYVELPAKG